MPKLTIDELKKMRESSKKNLSLREGNFRGKLIVHLGTCGIAAGAREIMNTLLDEIDKHEITDVMFTSTGCAGLCSEPGSKRACKTGIIFVLKKLFQLSISDLN